MKTSSSNVGLSQGKQAAFTMADLVVTVATVALLGGLILSARATTRSKPGLVECKNNLRQVGAAIEQYAQDNTNSLPGPLWAAVFMGYRKTGDSSGLPTTWSLPYHLTQYLGIPAPDGTYREADVLKCPASYPFVVINTNNMVSSGMCYFSVSIVTNRTGSTPVTLTYPFGRPNTPTVSPSKITDIKRPSEQWSIVDADQKIVPGAALYYPNLAPGPVHNNRPGGANSTATSLPLGNRNYLYFDGSVHSAMAAGPNL